MIKVHSRQDERKNRKTVFGFVALFAALAVIVGVGYAYFSDVITGDGTATAGTLDISGTVTLQQNGEDVTGTDITNLNPGDVVTFSATDIKNTGNKAAWIREVLTFSAISSTDNAVGAGDTTGDLASYLYVCDGTTPSATVQTTAVADLADAGCKLANTTDVFGAKTTYTLADVIPGTGTGAESEGNWTAAAATMPFIYFARNSINRAGPRLSDFSFSGTCSVRKVR